MGKVLTNEQELRAVELMRQYLAAPEDSKGQTLLAGQAKRDQERAELIENTLKPLIAEYLAGKVPLDEFKSQIDGLNKRQGYWGFKGIKGQMFFNIVVNRSADMAECDAEIKAAIAVPNNEDVARSRIRNFSSYIKRIGDEHVDAGGNKQGRPKPGSVPFFLSYFWQVQERETWPVYYTNSVNLLTDLNFCTPTGDNAADYITYKKIHEELAELFTRESGREFGLYDVEHVFWFKGGNPYEASKTTGSGSSVDTVDPEAQVETLPHVIGLPGARLPDSYVPPIVAILPTMAFGGSDMIEVARASGTSLERAFEKHIDAAFTILGYETTLLGQGAGRVPDGLALDMDDSYAILWDAKVRSNGYSMGTDDRTIREYIVTQSRDLKRRRSLRNIYYFIVSSMYADDYDDAIRMLKMDTDVNEVCLIEASAMVAMVDAALRDPQQITLGPDGLQRLFSASGVISADLVKEMLG